MKKFLLQHYLMVFMILITFITVAFAQGKSVQKNVVSDPKILRGRAIMEQASKNWALDDKFTKDIYTYVEDRAITKYDFKSDKETSTEQKTFVVKHLNGKPYIRLLGRDEYKPDPPPRFSFTIKILERFDYTFIEEKESGTRVYAVLNFSPKEGLVKPNDPLEKAATKLSGTVEVWLDNFTVKQFDGKLFETISYGGVVAKLLLAEVYVETFDVGGRTVWYKQRIKFKIDTFSVLIRNYYELHIKTRGDFEKVS